MISSFQLFADYNQWQNAQLLSAASGLSEVEYKKDVGSFFKSVEGTLNHILVADIFWLRRFSSHSRGFQALKPLDNIVVPSQLDQILYASVEEFRVEREKMDALIVDWCDEISEDDLGVVISYDNTKGFRFNREFSLLVQHFFNHQTHHRGQVTALLSQFDIDYGVTDMMVKTPDLDL